MHRARGLLVCLRESDVKLLFRHRSAQHFDPPKSDREGSTVAPTSVRFRYHAGGGVSHPWGRPGRLSPYAMRKDASPDASGLLRVDRPPALLGA